MSIAPRNLLYGLLAAGTAACAAQEPATCPPPAGIALQVLGSGGPIADDGRASAGYVVWVDGESRVLIDAGGGTFLRFAETGASFAALDFVGLSHFHADHSADFIALLKSGNFSSRETPLRVVGPDGAGPFPGLESYLDSLLRPDGGAYGYLSGYLDGSRGLARLEQVEVDRDAPAPVTVYADSRLGVEVRAIHVPHGIVPALAFRVTLGAASLVFASDQNGSDAKFIEFAEDADLLVMHMPVPEGATGGVLELHAKPGRIGEVAAAAGAGRLVLSHFMARSLRALDDNVAIVRDVFDGDVVVAEDLLCLPIEPG